MLKVHGTRGAFTDLLALPGRLEVVDALIADGLEVLREAGAATVLCWLPQRHPYRRTLQGRGFVSARTRVPLTTRPGYLPDDAYALMLREDLRFHYSLGDSDWT